MRQFSSNNPAVIAAEADARVRVLEARAKLHPVAQIIGTLGDKIGEIVMGFGCLIIFVIIVLAFFAPDVLSWIIGR